MPIPDGLRTPSGMRVPPVGDINSIATASAAASAAPNADLSVASTAQPTPTSVATLARPQGNDGVSIRYAGQSWTSAGRAVPLQGSAFERIGEYAGFSVYRQPRVNDDVIYVQTRDDLVAPYRLKR
jgi:hypothetical protein